MERAPGSIRLCVLAPTRERERAHLYNRRSHPPACHSIPPFSPLGPDKSRKAFAIHTTGEDRSVWASAIKIWAPKSLAIIRTSCYGGLFSPVNGGLWSCRRRSYPPRWHLPSAKCSQDRWPGNSPVWACHRWANPAARPCVSHYYYYATKPKKRIWCGRFLPETEDALLQIGHRKPLQVLG